MKTDNFFYLIRRGLFSVWQNRLMSFATFCIMTVSLLLIGLCTLFAVDFNIALKETENMSQIMVFCDRNISQTQIDIIKQKINSTNQDGLIIKVDFKSRDEILEEKRNEMDADDIFGRLVENPMPDTFIVYISDITKTSETASAFSGIEGVDTVKAPYGFVETLAGLRRVSTILGISLFAAMTLVTVVIVYNSVRSSVHARRLEIGIMRDFGATPFFIRMPFFAEGIFVGLVSGIVSFIITGEVYKKVLEMFLSNESVAAAFGIAELLPYSKIAVLVFLGNCLAGVVFGSLGTAISLRKYLKIK